MSRAEKGEGAGHLSNIEVKFHTFVISLIHLVYIIYISFKHNPFFFLFNTQYRKTILTPTRYYLFMIPSCAAHLLPEYYIHIKTKNQTITK